MWQKLSIQETRSNKPVIRGWRDDDPYYIMGNIWQNSCLQFPGGRSRVYCTGSCGEKIEKNQGISVCWLLLNIFVLRRKKKKNMSRRKLVILQAEIRVSGNSDTLLGKFRGVIWWINNLSKLWEIIEDRESWCAAVHGVANSQNNSATEQLSTWWKQS